MDAFRKHVLQLFNDLRASLVQPPTPPPSPPTSSSSSAPVKAEKTPKGKDIPKDDTTKDSTTDLPTNAEAAKPTPASVAEPSVPSSPWAVNDSEINNEIDALLDPFDEDLDDYFVTVKQRATAPLGGKISFPPNEGCGFTKDNVTHVRHLRECFKTLKVALLINISTMQDQLAAAPEFLDSNTAILMAMRGLLEARQDLWYTCEHGEDTFHTLWVLETTEMRPSHRQCLLDAIAMTSAKQKRAARSGQNNRPRHSQNYPPSRGRGGQPSRGKSDNAYPYKPARGCGHGSPAAGEQN